MGHPSQRGTKNTELSPSLLRHDISQRPTQTTDYWGTSAFRSQCSAGVRVGRAKARWRLFCSLCFARGSQPQNTLPPAGCLLAAPRAASAPLAIAHRVVCLSPRRPMGLGELTLAGPLSGACALWGRTNHCRAGGGKKNLEIIRNMRARKHTCSDARRAQRLRNDDTRTSRVVHPCRAQRGYHMESASGDVRVHSRRLEPHTVSISSDIRTLWNGLGVPEMGGLQIVRIARLGQLGGHFCCGKGFGGPCPSQGNPVLQPPCLSLVPPTDWTRG